MIHQSPSKQSSPGCGPTWEGLFGESRLVKTIQTIQKISCASTMDGGGPRDGVVTNNTLLLEGLVIVYGISSIHDSRLKTQDTQRDATHERFLERFPPSSSSRSRRSRERDARARVDAVDRPCDRPTDRRTAFAFARARPRARTYPHHDARARAHGRSRHDGDGAVPAATEISTVRVLFGGASGRSRTVGDDHGDGSVLLDAG